MYSGFWNEVYFLPNGQCFRSGTDTCMYEIKEYDIELQFWIKFWKTKLVIQSSKVYKNFDFKIYFNFLFLDTIW